MEMKLVEQNEINYNDRKRVEDITVCTVAWELFREILLNLSESLLIEDTRK
jgi:hypothetical protein